MWTKLALRRLRSSHYSGKMITAFNKLVFLSLAPNLVYQSVNSVAYFVFRSFWSYHAIQICILFYGNIKKDAKKYLYHNNKGLPTVYNKFSKMNCYRLGCKGIAGVQSGLQQDIATWIISRCGTLTFSIWKIWILGLSEITARYRLKWFIALMF